MTDKNMIFHGSTPALLAAAPCCAVRVLLTRNSLHREVSQAKQLASNPRSAQAAMMEMSNRNSIKPRKFHINDVPESARIVYKVCTSSIAEAERDAP